MPLDIYALHDQVAEILRARGHDVRVFRYMPNFPTLKVLTPTFAEIRHEVDDTDGGWVKWWLGSVTEKSDWTEQRTHAQIYTHVRQKEPPENHAKDIEDLLKCLELHSIIEDQLCEIFQYE